MKVWNASFSSSLSKTARIPLFVTKIIGDKQQCDNNLNFCYMSEIMTKTVVHLRFFLARIHFVSEASIDWRHFVYTFRSSNLVSNWKSRHNAISLVKISLLSYQFRTRRTGSVDRNGSGSDRKPFFCSAPLQVNWLLATGTYRSHLSMYVNKY